jgi:hypothetical protein
MYSTCLSGSLTKKLAESRKMLGVRQIIFRLEE